MTIKARLLKLEGRQTERGGDVSKEWINRYEEMLRSYGDPAIDDMLTREGIEAASALAEELHPTSPEDRAWVQAYIDSLGVPA